MSALVARPVGSALAVVVRPGGSALAAAICFSQLLRELNRNRLGYDKLCLSPVLLLHKVVYLTPCLHVLAMGGEWFLDGCRDLVAFQGLEHVGVGSLNSGHVEASARFFLEDCGV